MFGLNELLIIPLCWSRLSDFDCETLIYRIFISNKIVDIETMDKSISMIFLIFLAKLLVVVH